MASANSCDNFLVQFRAINQGMKKRFFRKPNVADAIDQYESLCKELEHDHQLEFAAVCSLEQAKCYETIQNTSAYSSSLRRGAQNMIDAANDFKNFDVEDGMTYGVKIGNRVDGQIQVAVQALEQCIKPHVGLGDNGLVVLLNMKIGQILAENHYFDQALKFYEEALRIAENKFTLPDQLVILESVLKCKIQINELESASQTVTEYLDKVNKISGSSPSVLVTSFLLKLEITRVCLLLILGCQSTDFVSFLWPENKSDEDIPAPLPTSLKDHLQEVKMNSSDSNNVTIFLKSLALAVQHCSVPEIHVVHDHLAPYLDEAQHMLFRILIQLQS